MPPALLPTLTRLIAEPTVSPHPTVQVAAHLAERAEACGFRVSTFDVAPGRANLIARAGPAGTDGLALSGHMDVVPVDGQDWSSDPWKLTERGGRLYGRGTADMKGFLAAATVAVEQLPLDRLRRELVLVWTADEEIGCVGSRRLAQDHLAGSAPLASPGERPLPSATLIGEPTDWRICRLHPGHTTLELVATGVPAHSSRPGLGVNALAIINHALTGLFELARALESERAFEDDLPSPFTIVNPACIHGGSAVNIVPERCSLAVGVRALPGQTEQDVLDRVWAALGPAQRAAEALGGTLELVQGRHAPPLLTPAGTALEALLAPHAADPRATGAPFATDGGNLAALGSHCLVFGPGSIDVAHKPDEYVPAADLLRAVDVVSAMVRARCIEVDT